MFEDYRNPNDYWMWHTGECHEEYVKTGCYGTFIYLLLIIIVLFLCAIFCSCTTKEYVPVVEHKTDTLIQTKIHHDSIYQKDSIHIRESGDTVYFMRWHTQLVKKELHDTTYVSKTDTIPVPYPVIKEVTRPLTKTQKLLMLAGGLSLFALFVFGIYKVKRFLPGV